jgi:hypothetical protein
MDEMIGSEVRAALRLPAHGCDEDKISYGNTEDPISISTGIRWIEKPVTLLSVHFQRLATEAAMPSDDASGKQ